MNVTAGAGGKSYMSYLKVPQKLQAFCDELNHRRRNIDITDAIAIYELSFWAHYELVTIHPWADGNGRTSRLLMNLLQMEHHLLPTKVLKEEKATYIQALIDTRETENTDIFSNCMAALHIQHLQQDIDQFQRITTEKVVDKSYFVQEMVGKWSIKPSLANRLADILLFAINQDSLTTESIVNEFGYPATSAKRYLRQLTEFGYLQAQGGNKNRKYLWVNKDF